MWDETQQVRLGCCPTYDSGGWGGGFALRRNCDQLMVVWICQTIGLTCVYLSSRWLGLISTLVMFINLLWLVLFGFELLTWLVKRLRKHHWVSQGDPVFQGMAELTYITDGFK